jgi:hypothetical protein
MTTEKVVTDEQLGALYRRTREFSDRVEKGVIPYDVAMDYLQAAFDGGMLISQPEKGLPPTFKAARYILGSVNARSQKETSSLWNLPLFESEMPVRYCEERLRQAAASNKRGETSFQLVCFPGNMSVFRQYEICGKDIDRKPSFFQQDKWLLFKEKKFLRENVPLWSNISSPAGFYLLDLKPRFKAVNNGWHGQEKEIGRLGAKFERAPADVFLFAMLSNYKLGSRKNVGDWLHWTNSVAQTNNGGDYVYIGLDAEGWVNVGWQYSPENSTKHYVSLFRKYDF